MPLLEGILRIASITIYLLESASQIDAYGAVTSNE